MQALSANFENIKDQVSEFWPIKKLTELVEKVRKFGSDVFYTFCYFACPWMRSKPLEIHGFWYWLSASVAKREFARNGYRIVEVYCGDIQLTNED